MPKRPEEIFGFDINDDSADAKAVRENHLCPFLSQECTKQSRLLRNIPFGVCSVKYDDKVLALCPNRFLEDSIVFENIAQDYFGSTDNILLFSEIGVTGIGRIDFVLVKHRQLSSDIEDFCGVEFQTGQTTSTGALVQAYQDYLAGEDIRERNYSFGINYADIWKRTFTQILNKGIVFEHWEQTIYWVVQEDIYMDFAGRYGLADHTTFTRDDATVFAIYDLVADDIGYGLKPTRKISASVDELFHAFRHNTDIPSKQAFLRRIKDRIEQKAQLDFNLNG